jgi:hypothetical protein
MNLRVRTVHALSAMATATLDRDTALGIDERQEAEQRKERKVGRKCDTKQTSQSRRSTAQNSKWPNPNSRNPKKGYSRGSPLLPPAISYVLRSEPHFSAQGT